MNSPFGYSLKVGLGYKPDESIPQNPLQWGMDQLDLPAYNTTVSKHHQRRHGNLLQLANYELKDRAWQIHLWFKEMKKNERDSRSNDSIFNAEKEARKADVLRHAINACDGANQVNQRLTHFWMNHFTVGELDFTRFIMGDYEREAIAKNLKSTFAEMLYDAITHPAMLEYLDNTDSIGPKSKWGRSPGNEWGLNDNLAREVLELHTVTPSAGYTESDVRSMAHILSGWGINYAVERTTDAREIKRIDLHKPFFRGKSEPGSSNVIGRRFSNGRDGLKDVLDYLAEHPKTVETCCYKLCQHFVSDDPSTSVVNDLISVWQQSGGSLRTVHQKVLELAYKNESQKLLWPSTWAYQATRVIGAELHFLSSDDLSDLGMSFWSRRQPNGYSSVSTEWISMEYMDRRLRYLAQLLRSNVVAGLLSPKDLAERLNLDQASREAVRQNNNKYQKYALALCSPDFMFV